MLQRLGGGAEADIFSDDLPRQDANGAAILWMIWPLCFWPEAVQHKAEVTDFASARPSRVPAHGSAPGSSSASARSRLWRYAGSDLVVAFLTLDGAETLAAGIATLVL